MNPRLNAQIRNSADAASQAAALAAAVAAQLREAVARRGQALLAVSGGRSPIAFFDALSRCDLPWAQVRVLLADERCVPPEHADSNARLVRQHLLQAQAGAAHLLPFFEALPADWQEPATEAELQALAEQAESHLAQAPWPLDVLVLGLGEDGHTASLFPGASGLPAALQGPQRVAWVRPRSAAHDRLTLTLPVLQQARHAHLALAGRAKHEVLGRGMAQVSDALPASHVLHRPGTPLQVWCAP